jgi:hypothetical protein
VRALRATKQRRQHCLQAGDQVVCLAGALGEVLNLIIFHGDFSSKKSDFAVFLF